MSKETTKAKITDFRSLTTNNSASPEVVGVIMDEILELNPIQNNIVKVLEIPKVLLSGTGTIEQQICEYVLLLPEIERTILETDSKWNIYVKPPLKVFGISSTQVDLCTGTAIVDTVAYHDGVNEYPVVGDSIYTDELGTTFYPANTDDNIFDPYYFAYTTSFGSNLGIDVNGKAGTDTSFCR